MISKTYDYLNAEGHLIFQVVRYEPKKFAQRRPFKGVFAWGLTPGWYAKAESGEYFKNIDTPIDPSITPPPGTWIDGLEPVLYCLPALIKAIADKQTVFICEGEKDADNLATFGYVATTCPMGAGKWRNSYTDTLKGCPEAVVIPDRDKPGLKHAETVAKELFSVGVPVKVLELPDIESIKVKDFSDWMISGGKSAEFQKMVDDCPYWEAPTLAPTEPEDNDEPIPQEFKELFDHYGQPYYLNDKGKVSSLNQSFWAGLHQAENIQLFEPNEKVFYRYNPKTGLYSVISEDTIKTELASRILTASRELGVSSLECKRSNSDLNNIVSLLKGHSEKQNVFQRNKKIIHLSNGVVQFNDQGEANFHKFSEAFFSRNQSPIAFDPSATCPRFLNELVIPSVNYEDAVLLQKYTGLALLGTNLIQRFLILDGKAGRGKSTLALIIQKLVGEENVTELRTKFLSDRFELFRCLKKKLLIGVDVPGDFMSEKGAHVIKKLVGGDPLDAEQKGGTGSFPFKGDFCIVITANSRLQVRLDGDVEAWRRRSLIIRFEGPLPPKKIPKFADLLIQEEGSGILNWALEGIGLLLKDINEYGDVRLKEEQISVVDNLLAESDSLRHFLKDNLVQDNKHDLTTNEIFETYAEYCPLKKWNPKPITVIHRELEGLMLELFGTAKSNSIPREGKNQRGFRNVAFKSSGNT